MEKQPTKLLIVTGPQGSGNHLWAKVFSMHPAVVGWPMLRQEWQGHHEEPFNEYWEDPTQLDNLNFDAQPHKNYITSISCPYFKDKEQQIPKYSQFVKQAKKKFDQVMLCIIGRDRDILKMQQTRVRKNHTTPLAMEQFEHFNKTICENTNQFVGVDNVQYISTELLYLYGGQYLKSLEKNIQFPIAWNHETLIQDYIKKNTNSKYLSDAEKGDFDEQVYKAVSES